MRATRSARETAPSGPQVVGSLALALAVAFVLLLLFDAVFAAMFPVFVRLRYNFSALYLARELRALETAPRGTIVLGDSTIWGFGVAAREAAVSLVATQRHDWTNLAYAGGGPVNSLAMVELLLANGVRPRAVVFNVNQKHFNASDSAFGRLYPAVEQLAWPISGPEDRSRLTQALAQTPDARIDRRIGRLWRLYGMRADLRDALFGDVDAAHALRAAVERVSGAAATSARAHRPTPAAFEGTYDLAPLTDANPSFRALLETASLLRAHGIVTYAILAPTNHGLLHEYIDGPEYRANLQTVRGRLQKLGATVLDFDRVIPSAEFIDNDHLTIAGNRRLARLIEKSIPT